MVTYRLEAGDVTRAAQLHYRSGMRKRVMFWLTLSALVIFLFALGILGDARQSLTIVLLPIALGTVVVTHLAMYLVFIPRSCRKHYTMYRRLQLPRACEFDEAGLRFKDDLGQDLMPWDYIHRWLESEDMFLLYPTRSQYNILPKRAFSHGGDIERLRSFLGRGSGAKVVASAG